MPASSKLVGRWLLVCAVFVLAMVVVGGLTRLTRAGLSIVEWKPITGVLPPIGEVQWLAEFAKYQGSPEFRLVNHAMDLDGFKDIFLVEWAHRLLGRITGFVVLIPFVLLLATRRLRGLRALRILGIFLLGGLQGAVGWYMVKSGLVDEPRVSHERLALHLMMALTIFAALLWCSFDELFALQTQQRRSLFGGSRTRLTRWATATVMLAALTCCWGAFMAGLHAGHVAPTFPTMNGDIIPAHLFAVAQPGGSPWLNLFDNGLTVHFVHRLLAYAVAVSALLTTAVVLSSSTTSPRPRLTAIFLLGVIGLQIALGAQTVLHHVPIVLAALHQLNAALLLGTAVALLHAVRRG